MGNLAKISYYMVSTLKMLFKIYIIVTALEDSGPLIFRAALYGELDTLTTLIEDKGVNPRLADKVTSGRL